ncbi:MAG: hypothetical protein AAGE98_15715 [Actinomycetota bacterium]
MTGHLLLDVDRAIDLHVTMNGIADQLDADRRVLAQPVADAIDMLGTPDVDPDLHLRALADLLRREAEDLARRVRMVALGGPEINAGLHALEVVSANWGIIDNRGRPDGNDGIISRGDLEWAADHPDPAIAAAASWLLDHDEFFAAAETAKHNDRYLADGGAGFAADHDEADGKLSIADVDAYLSKLDTWATLVPHMVTIDIAAHGGELDGVMSQADFEAFLDLQGLPPQVRQAAQQVLDDSAFHDTGGIGWDDVLMVASFIPIVGDFVDGAMALYYLSQGDWDQAALAGLGLLPIPGVTGASVRGAKAAAEEVAEELAEEAVETAAQRAAREELADAGGAARRTDTSETLDAHRAHEADAGPPPSRGDEGKTPSGGGGGGDASGHRSTPPEHPADIAARQAGHSDYAEFDASTSTSTGMFGVGSADRASSDILGEQWVGPNAIKVKDGDIWVSDDLLRQYRRPAYKPRRNSVQANFEWRSVPNGRWGNNGHLDITDP